MKVTLALLCIIPMMLCAPESLGLGGGSPFTCSTDALNCDIQIILEVLGTDPTEQACEPECNNLIRLRHVLNCGCPRVCHEIFKKLVAPDSTDPAASKCNKTTPIPITTIN